MQLTRFPRNDIMSLVGEAPHYDLGESVGPDMRLAELLDASGQESLGEMMLGYATAEGDPQLRKAIADTHEVHADDVVITVGGMHALFLLAFILCERGAEVVTTSPLFPLARNALEVVGAQVRVLPLSFERKGSVPPPPPGERGVMLWHVAVWMCAGCGQRLAPPPLYGVSPPIDG